VRLRPRFSAFNLIAAAIGAALLVVTVRASGWDAVVSGIGSVGWAFALVVLLGALRMGLRARAWTWCLEAPDSLALGDAFGAMMAADALGNLTPLGLLASEPTKVLLSRRRISTVASVSSVTIENGFYIASVTAVLLTGAWFFFQRANVPQALEWFAEALVVALAAGGAVFLWAARTQPAVLSRLAPLITRLAGKTHAPADALREVEARIYAVLRWPLSRMAGVLVWEALFHVFAVAEVWLVLRLLPGGEHTTLLDAFLMEAAGRFVTIAFKFIPYRVGVDEAGAGAVGQVIGLSSATGVTLALVRKIRILVLNAVGLIPLVRHGR
jgi:hypothetical protein